MVGTKACTNSVLVKSNAKAPTKEVKEKPSDDHDQKNTSLSAASVFSLGNVPWGWVAVLVILVLFATVLYLLFNRTKI